VRTRHVDGPARDVTTYLGLGGNLGDRLAELRAGLAAVAAHPRMAVRAVSGVYESAYVGPGEAQCDYLNACVRVETDLSPRELLAAIQGIERARGRAADSHMKPRRLDLDILLYGSVVLREPGLEIPHPRLAGRAFVLEPLAELDPGLILPDSGQTVAQLCAMIRAAEGRTARRRPETLLSALAAVE